MNHDFNSYHATNFEWLAKEPHLWRRSADDLKFSADVLAERWDEIDQRVIADKSDEWIMLWGIGRSYLLLAGLALENLVKGICIKNDPTIVSQQKVEWGRSGHELTDLFDKAGITLDTDELRFIEKLQEFVLWVGRYSLPKRASDYTKRSDQTPMVGMPGDKMMFEQVYGRVSKMYP